MNEFWTTILGAAVGAIISLSTSYLMFLRQSKRDDFVYLCRKKEEVYIETNDLIYKMNHTLTAHPTKEEAENVCTFIKEEMMKIHPKLILYGSEKVKNKFLEIIMVPDIIRNNIGEEYFKEEKRVSTLNRLLPLTEEFLALIKDDLAIFNNKKSKGFSCNLCCWICSKLNK